MVYILAAYLDLSKAFDKVNHTILLWKLHHYFGIRGTALHLIESYLRNRYQYTNVQGHYSNNLKITMATSISRILSWTSIVFALYQ